MSVKQLAGSRTEDVVAWVNSVGLKKTAANLGVSDSTLSRWLNAQGYRAKPQYMLKEVKTSKN